LRSAVSSISPILEFCRHRYVKTDDELPTIGILLCHRKHDALVELTLPRDSNIFASKYQLYLPSKEELKRQLEEAAGIILVFRSHRSLSSETISLFSTPRIIT
jgi:hypothetical protein